MFDNFERKRSRKDGTVFGKCFLSDDRYRCEFLRGVNGFIELMKTDERFQDEKVDTGSQENFDLFFEGIAGGGKPDFPVGPTDPATYTRSPATRRAISTPARLISFKRSSR